MKIQDENIPVGHAVPSIEHTTLAATTHFSTERQYLQIFKHRFEYVYKIVDILNKDCFVHK